MFSTDFRRLAILLTPTFLRSPVISAMLTAMAAPLQTLRDKFNARRDDNLFRLGHNGQVCRIKHALNSQFGITDYQAGFQIEDITARGDYLLIHDLALWSQEPQRAVLPPDTPDCITIYHRDEIERTTATFIVHCPAAATTVTNQQPDNPIVSAIVERYRPVSRTATYHQL